MRDPDLHEARVLYVLNLTVNFNSRFEMRVSHDYDCVRPFAHPPSMCFRRLQNAAIHDQQKANANRDQRTCLCRSSLGIAALSFLKLPLPNGHLTSQDEVLIGAPQDAPTFTPCVIVRARRIGLTQSGTLLFISIRCSIRFPGLAGGSSCPPTQYRRAPSFRRPSIITAPASDILKTYIVSYTSFARRNPETGKVILLRTLRGYEPCRPFCVPASRTIDALRHNGTFIPRPP
jgi:hypothetical protein